MSKSFRELNDAIIQWGIDRNLIQQNPTRQLAKMLEEYHELVDAHQTNNTPEIKDAIGDVQVTILIYCAQRGFDPLEALCPAADDRCFEDVWESVRASPTSNPRVYGGALNWYHLYGAHEAGVRGSTLSWVGAYYRWLLAYCAEHGYDPVECLDLAYEEIRDRSGKIVGGKFKKSKDYGGA